jgi:Uma2 family endonuclease
VTETLIQQDIPPPFPNHTQLPEADGTFVKNFQEHPQSILLTDALEPVLQRLHPDGQYAIGQDCGIYWRETDPPEKGAEAPDWFYVPNVPPLVDGQIRRSYVLWREYISPMIAMEFASGDGSEERDKTPLARSKSKESGKPGKFWIYEQVMRIPYYAIYRIVSGQLEVYHLVDTTYQYLPANERSHYVIEPMQVELGVWYGTYQNYPEQPWLRWWDLAGNLLLTGREQATLAKTQLQEEKQKRQQLTERLQSLTPEQRAMLGIDSTLLE